MKYSSFHLQIIKAVKLARDAHENQFRKGSYTPYIIHPLRVGKTVWESKTSNNLKVDRKTAFLAAILHDVLEDSNTNPRLIEKTFGNKVLKIVEELTQNKNLSRKKRRLEMVEYCKLMSNEAKLIKLADREDNLSDMKPFGKRSNIAYCRETIKMLDNGSSGICPEIEKRIKKILVKTLKNIKD